MATETTARKNYQRGRLRTFKISDDKKIVYGSLECRVKNTQERTTGTGKNVFEITAYGYYPKSSDIEYCMGEPVLYGENGSANIRGTAWDNQAGFTKKANLRPGDLIRIYGLWSLDKWIGKDGTERKTLECSIEKVEVIYRNRNNQGDAAQETAQPQPAQEAAPVAQETVIDLEAIGNDLDSDDLTF